ncbi:MAG: ABC transporter ATP-binding protein [Clostridia bacterium]|nr:ABC transporter ATP-binding protein [Clostridia bacterium]
MPKITVSHLTAIYRSKQTGEVVALDDLSAEFLPDAFNVVIGYSGCGKTTLLKCIAGLKDHDGDILFDDNDVFDLSPADRGVSYVSQEFVLYPHLTIFDNIAFPLKNSGVPKKEIIERVKQVAEELDLTYCLTRKPKNISGGQQQRVALARALVKKPSICLLDEPFSNADIQLRSQQRQTIKEKMVKYGCTTIYVTHDFQEAMALADKLFVLNEGKCVLQGDPKTVFDSGNEIVVSLKGEGGKQ